MAKNVDAGRLTFTLDLPSALEGADAVFIAVGTPKRRGDGHADLTYVMDAAEEIAQRKIIWWLSLNPRSPLAQTVR